MIPPFSLSHQYTWFTEDSAAITKASELAEGASDGLDVITSRYNYVIENVSYDDEKARTVQSGYLPDVDDTLASGKGICFDYAALMTAMLRSQGIPTKLEIGYSGEIYHAWISTYIEEIGWVDNVIGSTEKAGLWWIPRWRPPTTRTTCGIILGTERIIL